MLHGKVGKPSRQDGARPIKRLCHASSPLNSSGRLLTAGPIAVLCRGRVLHSKQHEDAVESVNNRAHGQQACASGGQSMQTAVLNGGHRPDRSKKRFALDCVSATDRTSTKANTCGNACGKFPSFDSCRAANAILRFVSFVRGYHAEFGGIDRCGIAWRMLGFELLVGKLRKYAGERDLHDTRHVVDLR